LAQEYATTLSSTAEIRVVPGAERQGGGDVLTDILRQGTHDPMISQPNELARLLLELVPTA
jgi:hypothetical protein